MRAGSYGVQSLSLGVLRDEVDTLRVIDVRHCADQEAVDDYAERMLAGDEFPPIIAYYDGAEYWVSQGMHRILAAEKAGLTGILADVRPGNRRTATLDAVKSNSEHGVRRSRFDKIEAVRRLLEDDEWAHWSDRAIAQACAVSHTFVAEVRRTYAPQTVPVEPTGRTAASGGNVATSRTGLDGKQYPTRTALVVAPLDEAAVADDARSRAMQRRTFTVDVETVPKPAQRFTVEMPESETEPEPAGESNEAADVPPCRAETDEGAAAERVRRDNRRAFLAARRLMWPLMQLHEALNSTEVEWCRTEQIEAPEQLGVFTLIESLDRQVESLRAFLAKSPDTLHLPPREPPTPEVHAKYIEAVENDVLKALENMQEWLDEYHNVLAHPLAFSAWHEPDYMPEYLTPVKAATDKLIVDAHATEGLIAEAADEIEKRRARRACKAS